METATNITVIVPKIKTLRYYRMKNTNTCDFILSKV